MYMHTHKYTTIYPESYYVVLLMITPHSTPTAYMYMYSFQPLINLFCACTIRTLVDLSIPSLSPLASCMHGRKDLKGREEEALSAGLVFG